MLVLNSFWLLSNTSSLVPAIKKKNNKETTQNHRKVYKALKCMYKFLVLKIYLETFIISQHFHFRFLRYLIPLSIGKGFQMNATENSPYIICISSFHQIETVSYSYCPLK